MHEIPESFLNICRDARGRLRLPAQEVWARYEWCEDLAQQTSEPARTLAWQLGGGEAEILQRVRAGLQATQADGTAPLSDQEAWWIEVRIAELLNWPHPDRPVAE
ncbi:MAG: hypothetical protein RI907_1415 [Pseudomonadota bacterium]|jgi:hypothetical protein